MIDHANPPQAGLFYSGQRALVVGASGGIGRAIARELIDNGCDTAITYHRNRDEAEGLKRRALERGRRCTVHQVDLRDRDSIATGCKEVIDDLGLPSIVVTSAGIVQDRPFRDMDVDDWYDVLETNLSGNFHLLHELIPSMMRRGGRILNIASVSGLFGLLGQANYSAAKGGLIAMTRALARELGPFRITVNAIAPGYVETEMTRGISPRRRRQLLGQIPLRRFATPQDIVPMARLLMAPDGGYVTGQVLVVDGGLTC